MQEKLEPFDDIVIRNAGVGSENTTMYMQTAEIGSTNRIGSDGKLPVEVVRLDDDIQEMVTFIKIDIEGSELEAIEGARNHIINDKSKLAICTYHNNHHIWEIPKLMRDLNPDYKLYIRYNGSWSGFAVSEYVTFGV
ncbi:MAG: FkbM family methyltransferase [Lachnospiraceae bacterium]|nr:FkbM family methyltransferase [Lachnospiraceae bacterium]